MLNKRATGSDDESSESEYVLLEAEDPSEEAAQETMPETEPLLDPESEQTLAEEVISELTLDQFVDEPEVEDRDQEAAEEAMPESEPLLDSEPDQALVEEASDLTLEQFVNEPENKEGKVVVDGNEDGASETEDNAVEKTEEATIGEDPEEEGEGPSNPESAEFEEKDDEASNGMDGARKEGAESENACEKPEENTGGGEEPEPEFAEDAKENDVPVKTKDLGGRDFKFGTRREVNGAAAVFGFFGLILGGPLLGLVAAAASAHIAANKPCHCATATRRCGGALGNNMKLNKNRLKSSGVRKATRPHVWDHVTNRLVEGGEWTDQRLSDLRRVKAKGHTYRSKRKPTRST